MRAYRIILAALTASVLPSSCGSSRAPEGSASDLERLKLLPRPRTFALLQN